MREIDFLLERASYDNRILLSSGSAYVNENGFFIEVKEAGNVTYRTMGGQIVTESMSVGYHPIRLKEIFVTTAVDLTINF